MKKHLLALMILLVLSWWSIRPLLTSGFFPMHDDTQVGRVVTMGRSLRSGQFPVRWVADLGYGYGYPLFNFYGPLPYYPGGLAYSFGFNGLVATKLMFVTGIVLAQLAMYGLASNVFGVAGGLVAGVFYLFAPYHAVQVYVRGAVSEFWILVFLPVLALGLWLIGSRSRSSIGVIIGALGLAGLIMAHTILGYVSALFAAGALLVWWLITKKRNIHMTLGPYFSVVLLGLALSAFFWLPALGEMRFTSVAGQIGNSADYRLHFVCLNQLWNSPWGFGGSAPGCLDGMSFKLGKLHLLIAFSTMIFWFLRRRFWSQRVDLAFWSVFWVTIASIFLMTQSSEWLWQLVPLSAYIQYPWRFLVFAIFGLSFISGGIVLIWRNKLIRGLCAGVLIIGAVWFNAKWFNPQYIYQRPAADFESEEELKFRVSRISDEYLPAEVIRPQNLQEVVSATIDSTPGVTVHQEVDNGVYARYLINSGQGGEIKVNRAYFPGWQYLVNGKQVEPRLQDGLPYLNLPPHDSVVELRFRNTPVRTIANTLSLIAIGFLLIIYDKKTFG